MDEPTAPRILPALQPDTVFFWTSGADGRLRFLRCAACGHYLHPPGPVCPVCLGRELAPDPVSGRGMVAAMTINMQPWIPGLPLPYIVALVELPEQQGLRLTTNIVGIAPEAVRIGMAVEVVFEQHGEIFLPLFKPI